MDSNVSQELAGKLTAAKSAMAFMFNPDGTVQGFGSGDAHELMATVASEMEKSPFIKTVIEGAINLYQSKQS